VVVALESPILWPCNVDTCLANNTELDNFSLGSTASAINILSWIECSVRIYIFSPGWFGSILASNEGLLFSLRRHHGGNFLYYVNCWLLKVDEMNT
jgi:hypothetical protein